jgi:hypothetical protein
MEDHMARSRFSIISAMLVAAISYLVALPGRAVAFAVDIIDTLVLATDPQRIADLLRTNSPALAFDGPSDSTIDAALATEQRHEAGLKRLT